MEYLSVDGPLLTALRRVHPDAAQVAFTRRSFSGPKLTGELLLFQFPADQRGQTLPQTDDAATETLREEFHREFAGPYVRARDEALSTGVDRELAHAALDFGDEALLRRHVGRLNAGALHICALRGSPDLLTLVAQQPGIDGGTLQVLSHAADPTVLRSVAWHPAASMDVAAAACERLLEMHAPSPDPPSMPAWWAAAWAWLAAQPDDTRRFYAQADLPFPLLRRLAQDPAWHVRLHLAGNPHAPPEVLASLAGDEDATTRQEVARHHRTSPAILAALAQDESDEVREAALCHRDTPPEALERLHLTGGNGAAWDLASHPNTPARVLTALARHADWRVRARTGAHPRTPLGSLTDLSRDADEAVRAALLERPLPDALLRRLSTDSSTLVRQRTAEHPDSPPAALIRLAQDHDEYVRFLVARHPHVPLSAVQALAGDESDTVRGAVLARTDVPPEVLIQFARDGDADVRAAVASHPHVPASLLKQLVGDTATPVRAAAAAHPRATPEFLARLAEDAAFAVRIAVARHPGAPPDVLGLLALDRDADVRAAVVRHPAAPLVAVELLASDRSWRVRLEVARHPQLPPAALVRLTNDSNSSVQMEAIRHPGTPLPVVAALVRREPLTALVFAAFGHPGWTPAELHRFACADSSGVNILGEVASHANTSAEDLAALAHLDGPHATFIQERVARHPHTPAVLLARLARSGAADVLHALAWHPHTPTAVLSALTRDETLQRKLQTSDDHATLGHLWHQLTGRLLNSDDGT